MPPETAQTALIPVTDGSTFTAFRYSGYDVPFWDRENTRPGRWNHARGGWTQYWSLCPEASWAELLRYEEISTEAELDEVRMPLWVCRIPKLRLVDLTVPENRAAWGLTEEDLVADDWSAAQAAGVRLREAGVPGIVVPSAALPGHRNVTLFGRRRAIDWHTKTTLASTLPATRVAIGRPPPGLIPDVCRLGPGHSSQQQLDLDAQ
ncbi:MAG TPA: RES family NAD+ phosphorylase [Solirubrobacter sp.]|nr:RES family NAD+ phosphorylase [Solirubrobacter sp.]